MFYLDLFASLARHDVRYLLVGGLAMNLHGVPRMTMDVDIMLALDDANLEHFFAVAEELKLRPALPVSLKELADPAKRETWVNERHLIAFSLCCTDKFAPTRCADRHGLAVRGGLCTPRHAGNRRSPRITGSGRRHDCA